METAAGNGNEDLGGLRDFEQEAIRIQMVPFIILVTFFALVSSLGYFQVPVAFWLGYIFASCARGHVLSDGFPRLREPTA